jgi:hypothetical protein
MRVEAASYVFRTADRRQRSDTPGKGQDRRRPETERRRARHTSSPWLLATFGIHLIGQFAPERALPTVVRRAYLQPEARMAPRPRDVRTA